MTGKRLRNYLFYAIGEIVLVVIGILIALQINKLNNQSKLDAKEISYLKDIDENLEHDYENLEEYIVYNELKIAILDSSMITIASDKPIIDVARVMSIRMQELTTYRYFYPRRTAFDNMINAENISLITDDSLREMLSEYYFDRALVNTTQERVKELNRTFTNYFGSLILNKETLSQFYKEDLTLPGPGEIDFRGDMELLNIIFSLRMASEGQLLEFEEKMSQNESLQKGIAKYLQNPN